MKPFFALFYYFKSIEKNFCCRCRLLFSLGEMENIFGILSENKQIIFKSIIHHYFVSFLQLYYKTFFEKHSLDFRSGKNVQKLKGA
jgi:hypothetical protein